MIAPNQRGLGQEDLSSSWTWLVLIALLGIMMLPPKLKV